MVDEHVSWTAYCFLTDYQRYELLCSLALKGLVVQKPFLAVQSILKLMETPLVPSACCTYCSALLEKKGDQETCWEHQGLDSK